MPVIYVSATPGNFELERINYQPVEQIIRPTGLLDPQIELRTTVNQMVDIIQEIHKCRQKKEKVLIYALTIIMAEDIAAFLQEKDIKTVYLHSRLEIFERYQAIASLRRGIYDVIVGINLLKEGIDLPEVSLVCILDADKPGFLRDTRSLIQIIGRASRNSNGRVILYGDYLTINMREAIEETERRRNIQLTYNQKQKITPQTIDKEVISVLLDPQISLLLTEARAKKLSELEFKKAIKNLRKEMKKASRSFQFPKAIELRNALLDLESLQIKHFS